MTATDANGRGGWPGKTARWVSVWLGAAMACGLWIADVSAAMAQCVVCDEVVVLNDNMKTCFIDRYDGFAASLARSGKAHGVVDLSPCAGIPATLAKERALGGLPDLQARVATPRVKTRYTLDRRSLACLRGLVVARTGSFNPPAKFDLLTECK